MPGFVPSSMDNVYLGKVPPHGHKRHYGAQLDFNSEQLTKYH